MRIFLVVKSFVPTHLKKDFDDWYEKEHLFEAKQTFSAISASRGWQIENEDIHYAYYESVSYTHLTLPTKSGV